MNNLPTCRLGDLRMIFTQFLSLVGFGLASCESFRRQIKASHLSLIANQQSAVVDRRVVPGLAFNRRKFGKLVEFIRACFDQHQLAGVGNYHQVSARKNHLSVSVAATLPTTLTALYINAGQDSLIKPVNIALIQHRAIELVLHRTVFPDFSRRETVSVRCDLYKRGSLAIT